MHISEGVLSAPVLAAGFALGAAGVAVGLKKMSYDKLPEVAVLASVFFVASLVHVPIGPSAVHLILSGVCGLLLGWTAFPAILVGLALQALLFQYGGLTVLGTNTFIMAFPAVVLGLTVGKLIRNADGYIRWIAEFICGAGAVFLSGVLAAAVLMLTDKAFEWAAFAVVAVHVPIMILEGLITVFVVEFLLRVRPEMLRIPRLNEEER
ncbi:MAG: cobalt transporter CbiM [Desulfomonilaceae bacterium]|nr:cobalt transporter CbiM [Desulfomonilaceae bacterium]